MNSKGKNTTVQNRSKQQRLQTEHIIPTQNVRDPRTISFLKYLGKFKDPKEQILFSIGHSLLNGKSNPAVKSFLNNYKYKILEIKNIPKNEFDLLGSAYQFLNSKKENLEKGIFYTGKEIAFDFVKDLDFTSGQVIFDPSCGSGSFLFNSKAGADQIIGVDFDPIAIMIAKFNYFIKFPKAPAPKLYCQDYFEWFLTHGNLTFDYIVGNPPYGANIDLSKITSGFIKSGESFSYFIEYAYKSLKIGGVLRFLLPESILNVKRHTDIRDFILDHTNLKRIRRYSKKFTGVMSDIYLLELDRSRNSKMLFINGTATYIPKVIFKNFSNHIFVHLSEQDITILEKVDKKKKYSLSNSIFGLGVVTGDNKTKLLNKKIPHSEHIFTGKEVEKYRLLPPKKYLVFDRNSLQQVAPDEIYRAPIKFIYKTINKHLKVALDTSRSLTSNSANIVIPKVPDLDTYSVLAFLNSDLYSYLHVKLFGGVNKIAKESLMALPLPGITPEENNTIKKLTKSAIKLGVDTDLQEYINKNIYELLDAEIEYIRKIIGNKKKTQLSLSLGTN